MDAQGNVFIPKVGPVEVQGVKNQDLNGFISDAVKKVFLKNVGVYASLGGAEPVKVFVTGFVRKAGLFQGHSSDRFSISWIVLAALTPTGARFSM